MKKAPNQYLKRQKIQIDISDKKKYIWPNNIWKYAQSHLQVKNTTEINTFLTHQGKNSKVRQ